MNNINAQIGEFHTGNTPLNTHSNIPHDIVSDFHNHNMPHFNNAFVHGNYDSNMNQFLPNMNVNHASNTSSYPNYSTITNNYSIPHQHYQHFNYNMHSNSKENESLSGLMSINKKLRTIKKSKYRKLSYNVQSSINNSNQKDSQNETPLTTEKKKRLNMLKEIRQNKTVKCKCRKSKCMKNYCECFAKGEKCLDCNCEDCENQPFVDQSVPSTLRKVVSVGQDESSIMTNPIPNMRKSELCGGKDSFHSQLNNNTSNLNTNINLNTVMNEGNGLTAINKKMQNINLNSISSVPFNKLERTTYRYSETNTKRNLIAELNEVDLVSNYNTSIKKPSKRKISASSGLHPETATQHSIENNVNKRLENNNIGIKYENNQLQSNNNLPKLSINDHSRMHSDNKRSDLLYGCNCSKSNCRKKYCECYKAKRPCTDFCRCIECFNGFNAIRKPDKKLLNEVSILEKYIIEQISIQISKSVLIETRTKYLPPSPFCEIKINNDGSRSIIVDKTILRLYDVNDIDLVLREAKNDNYKSKLTQNTDIKQESEDSNEYDSNEIRSTEKKELSNINKSCTNEYKQGKSAKVKSLESKALLSKLSLLLLFQLNNLLETPTLTSRKRKTQSNQTCSEDQFHNQPLSSNSIFKKKKSVNTSNKNQVAKRLSLNLNEK